MCGNLTIYYIFFLCVLHSLLLFRGQILGNAREEVVVQARLRISLPRGLRRYGARFVVRWNLSALLFSVAIFAYAILISATFFSAFCNATNMTSS